MSYTNDAAQLTVRAAVESVKVALNAVGRGAKGLTVLIFAALREHSGTRGSMRISQMLKEGKEMRAFDIRDDDAELLCRRAKELGLKYTLLKDVESKDECSVILVPADEAGRFSRFLERCGIEPPFPEKERERGPEQDGSPDLNDFLRRAQQSREPDSGRNPISGRQDPESPSAPSWRSMRTAERERRELPRQERMSVRDFLRRNRAEIDLDLQSRERDKESLQQAIGFLQFRKENEK